MELAEVTSSSITFPLWDSFGTPPKDLPTKTWPTPNDETHPSTPKPYKLVLIWRDDQVICHQDFRLSNLAMRVRAITWGVPPTPPFSNRKYIFIHGGFSIAMLVYRRIPVTTRILWSIFRMGGIPEKNTTCISAGTGRGDYPSYNHKHLILSKLVLFLVINKGIAAAHFWGISFANQQVSKNSATNQRHKSHQTYRL